MYVSQLRCAKLRAEQTVPLLTAITLHKLTIVALLTPLADVVLISNILLMALITDALTAAPLG